MKLNYKKLTIFLIFAIVFVVIANIVIDNPYTHRLLRAAINEKIEIHTNLSVDFKALKASAFPPGLDLYGLYIKTSNSTNHTLLKASHVKARVSFWSLVMATPKLGVIQINDLETVWPPPWDFKGFLKDTPDKDDEKNNEEEPAVWPPEFEVPLEKLILNNARIYAEFPTSEDKIPLQPSRFSTSMIGFDLETNISDWNDFNLSVNVKSLNAAWNENSMIEDAAIGLNAEFSKDQINISRLAVNGERIKIDGTVYGRLLKDDNQKFKALELVGDTKATADLSILGSYLDLSDTHGITKGTARLNLTVPFDDESKFDFKLGGEGQVEDGYIYGFRLFNSKAKYEVDVDQIAFTDLAAIIGEQTVAKGSGVIKFNSALDFKFKAAPKRLALIDILDAFNVSFDLFNTNISSPDLVIKGRGFPFAMTVKATGDFAELSTPGLPYDHSTFPESPRCLLDVDLAITAKALDFLNSHGNCFNTPSKKNMRVVSGVLTPPEDAVNVSDLALSGLVTFDSKKGMDLLISSSNLNLALANYFAQYPVTGHGAARTRIHGKYSNILTDIRAKTSETTFAEIALGEVSAFSRIDSEKLSWQNVSIKMADEGAIESSAGTFFFDDKMTIELDVEAHSVPDSAISQAAKSFAEIEDLSFGIRYAEAKYSGPVEFPAAYIGSIRAHITDLKYGDETLANDFRADLTSKTEGWKCNELLWRLEHFKLAGNFTHNRKTPFSYSIAKSSTNPWIAAGLHSKDSFSLEFATVNAKEDKHAPEKKIWPDHLAYLPYIGSIFKDIGITGQISTKGAISGTTSGFQGTFTGGINHPSVFGSNIAPVAYKGFFKDSKLDLVLNQSGTAFEGRLTADVSKEKLPYEWYFNFKRFDIRPLGTEFFYNDPRNFAYITADWEMKGELMDWWRSTGKINIKDLRAKYFQNIGSQIKTLQMSQDEPVTVDISKDGWNLADEKELRLSGQPGQIRISVPANNPPEKIAVKLNAITDVGIARDFLPQIVESASGKLNIVSEISGSASKPQFSFEASDLKSSPFNAATWQPVSIGFADVRPPFRNVRLKVSYRDERFIIQEFSAEKGGGTVAANGSLNLSEQSSDESRIDLSFENATFIYPVAVLKSFEFTANGNLNISGKERPYRIGGDVKILRSRTTREVDIRDEIINALKQKTFSAQVVSDEPMVKFDLNILANQTININNRNIQAILSMNTHVGGTDSAPEISGQVNVVKGKFTYKREFRISRGIITFDDPIRPDPNLDILAQCDVSNYRVFLLITGRASDPTIEFSVNPPLREDGTPISKMEILVLLSRGSLPDVSQAVGDTQSAATSEAINLLMGQFEEPVEKLFDLSGQTVVRSVFIDTYPSEAGTPVPRLNLPLDLGNDFDVIVRVDQSTKKVSSEYSLHEAIKVTGSVEEKEGETSSANEDITRDAAFDLKFRFSFD